MGDLREPNGAVLEDSLVPSSSSSSSLGPDPFSNGLEVWARVEEATQEIIRQVQPTVVSEERRREVIDYVQRLLKGYLGCEVFPFGSVPLKTYLPDGDIDLTAFCAFNFEEAFANDVYSVLEAEDHNPAAEFVVKDVQYIRAEVKLVKCLVQNIVVDISFNQIGGLCALCFLEEVDRLIGKDHLFKRSIILIKAWCYYESRILGAHHGLISTYALETLVLYIFHLFHSTLSGPLAVLYKFLDYFSKFDWENYCVSLSGPVHLSSLPEIVAERPENGGGDLLLSDDFMRECVKRFHVPSRGNEPNFRAFMQKHLNIVDPLKENNNLGRSVSKGNFFRIRSAFSYGARKLGQILLQPRDNIAEEVNRFFTNTLDRHGQGQRPDVQDLLLMPTGNGFTPEMYAHEVDPVVVSNDPSGECRVGPKDTGYVVVGNVEDHPGTSSGGAPVEQQRGARAELSRDDNSASTSRYSGDLRISNHAHDKFPPEEGTSSLGNIPHAPHLYFSSNLENGHVENGDEEEEQSKGSRSFSSWEPENGYLCDNRDPSIPAHSNCHYLQDSCSANGNARSIGSQDTPNLLPDLSGDVDCHIDSLQYGRWWYDYVLSIPAMHPVHLPPPPPPPSFQRKSHWEAIRQSAGHFGPRDMVPPPHVNVNNVIPGHAFFPMNHGLVPSAPFGVDEMPKARGTGTYFPITNHHSYRERSSMGKGRNQGMLRSPRSNCRAPTSPLDRSPHAQSPVRQGISKTRSLDSHEISPRGKVFKEVNGFVHIPEKSVEFCALGPPSLEVPLIQERDSSGPPPPLDSSSSPGCQKGESVFVVNDRLGVQSYRLKDDEDFPPLSV